ncbi:MBL fold metallo-hydrolase RNA specificity domain-containing protein [Desulfonatronum sp. SC1]|uniref:MBL fold metallo-hydrolase RNA specificity domain-containing protein n=1 Tax=Desulfonatronum sp. SC1 TaxID=2109626 RepID=UPI000D32295E|nr:MBL fold metallo-hydrolase [Desulfonatronum sp. SC1]PTN38912.1 MBL fold hydrolase [Desulfonatronum sp. SC1]
MQPIIDHYGGAKGVTGSCHHLRLDKERALLVDCGLRQGTDAPEGDDSANQAIDFPVNDLVALVVTHVHIDHIGRLPHLVAAGYTGPILCSKPSAKLLPLVIEDALKIGFTRNKRLINDFLAKVNSRLQALEYKQWHTLIDDQSLRVRIKLQRAGHILGSSYVEVDITAKRTSRSAGKSSSSNHRVVFSGDLGAPHAPLLPVPRSPYRADTLVLESTYGNRLHEDRHTRRHRLKAAVDRALADGGTVLIPAFSIGRTQELLYEFESLAHDGGTKWRELEIIVDSPLANRFTKVYRELKSYWDTEAHDRLRAGRHPLAFENLTTVDSHKQHMEMVERLARTRHPAVVLAASGMAAGGRIVNYLKAMLGDPRHDVLFVGYQAPGTPGHAIQRYGPEGGWVILDGERLTIRAKVETISGYSAHADQRDLVNFVKRMRKWPSQIRLVHGDQGAREVLRVELLKMARERGHPMEVVLPGDDMGQG